MKLLTASVIASLVLTSGCATMFTGVNQDIEVRTTNSEQSTKLDNVAKFDVLTDAYRVNFENVSAGEKLNIHRKGAPIVVKIKESECILPSEERFASGTHPAVWLDVLATSLLSTSIDSSTGAAWRYDETLVVTPKIKDTPECKKWLDEQVAELSPSVPSKPGYAQGKLQNLKAAYPYDKDSVIHQKGEVISK